MTGRYALPLMSLALLTGACQEHHLAACDITERACQVDIYYRMLSLRGDGFDPFGGLPPVSVITEDEYRQILVQNAADQAAQNGPSPWDKALSLLHFTSSGAAGDSGSTIDDQVAHTYAFYSPEQKDVTIISHPNDTDPYAVEDAMTTLGHELVHALQDRELDLKKDDFQTSDEYFAYDTIIEGDARFYENLFANDVRGLLGMPPKDVVAVPTDELDYIYQTFVDQATPMFVAQLMVYSLGARYESFEYQSGGNPAIRRGYGKEPHHMVGFLAGDDGKMPAVNATETGVGLCTSSLPMQGKTVGEDELGGLLFYTFLRGWGVDHATAFATAQSWIGDLLLVQASADLSTTAVSWLLEFSAPPPSSIAATLSKTGELAVKPGTRSLQITATDSPSALTWGPAPRCQ